MISDAITSLWKKKSVVTFCYLISLFSALVVAVPFYHTLIKETNNSLSLNSLIREFDYLIFSDAFRLFSEALTPYLFQYIIVSSLYFLLMTFISGGIIDAIITGKFRFQRFFIYSTRFWGKTIVLLILLLCIFVLITCLSVLLWFFTDKIIPASDYRISVLKHLPSLIFWLAGTFFSFLIWDYSRIFMYRSQKSGVLVSFKSAMQQVFRKSHPSKTLLLLFVIVIAGLFLYLFIDQIIGMKSGFTIFLMFVIQQLFVYFRMFIRILHLKITAVYLLK